jgi:hypothetical protein
MVMFAALAALAGDRKAAAIIAVQALLTIGFTGAALARARARRH